LHDLRWNTAKKAGAHCHFRSSLFRHIPFLQPCGFSAARLSHFYYVLPAANSSEKPIAFPSEYYPPWEPPVSRFRATWKRHIKWQKSGIKNNKFTGIKKTAFHRTF